jgi:GNAT superfamily N-acetyltransferase
MLGSLPVRPARLCRLPPTLRSWIGGILLDRATPPRWHASAEESSGICAPRLAPCAWIVRLGAMEDTLTIRRATSDDLSVILGLIDEAATWLRTKDTDQWAKPWPNEAARDARMRRGLYRGKTWIAEEHGTPIATITYRKYGNEALWTQRELHEPAVYVSRLIVTRDAAGRGIGSALIDWAGQRGRRDWSAQWVRIDVWTFNEALHNYYEKRGFTYCRISASNMNIYPSAALFQKPTTDVDEDAAARFTEAPAVFASVIRAHPAPASTGFLRRHRIGRAGLGTRHPGPRDASPCGTETLALPCRHPPIPAHVHCPDQVGRPVGPSTRPTPTKLAGPTTGLSNSR